MRGSELVFAIIPVEPVTHEEVVQPRGVHRFAADAQGFEFLQLGGNQGEQVRPLGQLGQVVDAGNEVKGRASVVGIAEARVQVTADLVLGEWEQAEGGVRFRIKPLAILANEHGVLAHHVAEVVRPTRENHLPAANPGQRRGRSIPAGSIREYRPECADKRPRFLGSQVDDLLVEPIEDNESSFLTDEPEDVLRGHGAVGELPRPTDDLIQQLLNGRHDFLAFADVVAEVDVDRERDRSLQAW